MAKKTQEHCKENTHNFWSKEIAIAFIIHRNTVNNVEKVLNLIHNSYVPSMPVLDDPDHLKLVSQTENLAKFMVLGVVASSDKKFPTEWVGADAYIK